MMKKTTILVLMLSTMVFSQEQIVKELGTFTELKVFNGLLIKVEKSDNARVVITGIKRGDVVVKNINGIVKISMKLTEAFSSDEVSVQLYYADNISVIDGNEGAIIQVKEVFKQQSVELRAQEGAEIKIRLKVKYLIAKAVSGGRITPKGRATNQNLELSTGGSYMGYNLETDQSYVSASSGSVAQVFVNEILNAKVSLGGSIYYKGDPTDIITKKIIGGTIKSKD
jgi:hypothetical protein|tara:strand:- start:682 stop:1359 length:678 start_codon:yes stop_codon:yes gene_type:complete